jgi:hypothetical protein
MKVSIGILKPCSVFYVESCSLRNLLQNLFKCSLRHAKMYRKALPVYSFHRVAVCSMLLAVIITRTVIITNHLLQAAE